MSAASAEPPRLDSAIYGRSGEPLIENSAGRPNGDQTTVALVFLAFTTLLFVWWEWKQGAYFGQVFYPGAIGVFALLGMLVLNVPIRVSLRGPFGVALLGLVMLAAWTFLSLAWTNVPAAPVAYGERISVYVALFGIGAWAARSLGERMHLALLPVAVSGAVVGLATTVVLATGTDVTWYLQGDGTLRFPIGYRNADVAFLLICIWPLVSLAAGGRLRWIWKSLAVAAATVLVDLAVLGQSRGSIPALAIACVVFLLLTPNRLRAAAVIALVALPALPVLPALFGVFRHGAPDAGAVAPLHEAARAIGYSGAISLVLAAFAFGFVDPRLRLGRPTVRALSWAVGLSAVVVVVGAAAVFIGRHGGPIRFIDQRASEFGHTGYPNLHGQGIRFGANIGSNRHDFWRVAIDEGIEKPLTGGGAGSFQLAYLRHRQSLESPHDPHSIEAVVFSELGFPGLVLLIVFLAGAVWAMIRSARVSPLAASMVAGAAAAATQWFVHGSFDWFWQYAGVSGLGIYMLGAGAGPGLSFERAPWGRAARWGIAVCLLALALVAVPLFFSAGYLSRGIDQERTDPASAISNFRRAGELDPLDSEPPLLKGLVQSNSGETAAALRSFEAAANREPENYAPYLFAAETLLPRHRRAATEALERASELNPREPAIRRLQRRLSRHG